jgi:hypothetical protein
LWGRDIRTDALGQAAAGVNGRERLAHPLGQRPRLCQAAAALRALFDMLRGFQAALENVFELFVR